MTQSGNSAEEGGIVPRNRVIETLLPYSSHGDVA